MGGQLVGRAGGWVSGRETGFVGGLAWSGWLTVSAAFAVKGKRNPALWDPRCEQYMAKKPKPSAKSTVKVDSTS